jgi:hypothetical protein
MKQGNQSVSIAVFFRWAALGALAWGVLGNGAWLRAQTLGNVIAWIEGDAVVVKGPVAWRDVNSTALPLVNGNEIVVRAGPARLVFGDGSEAGICGPASFTLLQTGDARTIALNSGRIHLKLSGPGTLQVLTPLITAMPMSLGPDGVREATVGVDGEGSFCAWSGAGAMRVEHQMSGQALVVPQSGEILLPGGQMDSLRTSRGACGCDAMSAKRFIPPAPRDLELAQGLWALPGNKSETHNLAPEPKRSGTRVELSALAAPKPSNPAAATAPAPKPPAVEHPNWLVLMPPLSFEAGKPPAPEPDPQSILLLREVRVSPSVYYVGRVGPPAEVPAAQAPVAAVVAESKPKKSGGLANVIGSFFGRLFGRRPKAAPCSGAGCP